MAYLIDIQNNHNGPLPVTDTDISAWVELALHTSVTSAELSIRIVNLYEISDLNHRYRHKSGPTNVLSFPSELPEDIMKELEYPYIGDIIICPDVLAQESETQAIPLQAHWAHIVIHGVLHLLGHDHMQAQEEHIMQSLEIKLLQHIGIKNPYE